MLYLLDRRLEGGFGGDGSFLRRDSGLNLRRGGSGDIPPTIAAADGCRPPHAVLLVVPFGTAKKDQLSHLGQFYLIRPPRFRRWQSHDRGPKSKSAVRPSIMGLNSLDPLTSGPLATACATVASHWESGARNSEIEPHHHHICPIWDSRKTRDCLKWDNFSSQQGPAPAHRACANIFVHPHGVAQFV